MPKIPLVDYLKKHPKTVLEEARQLGYQKELDEKYDSKISIARKAAKVRPIHEEVSKAERERRLLAYLNANPHIAARPLIKAGYGSDLKICFDNRINAAKDAAEKVYIIKTTKHSFPPYPRKK